MKRKMFFLIITICISMSICEVSAQAPSIIVAKSGSTPTIDGVVGDVEWTDATSVIFNGTQVFLKQDGKGFYVGFKAPVFVLSIMDVYIDVNNERGLFLQPDDLAMAIVNNNTLIERRVVNNAWTAANIFGWTAQSQTTGGFIQSEFNITYAKITVAAGTNKTLSINFAYRYSTNQSTIGTVVTWSTGGLAQPENNPSVWGILSAGDFLWVPETISLLVLSLFMVALLVLSFGFKHSSTKNPRRNSITR